MHNASKFWSIKFLDANFLCYSIYDRFIQRQPSACIHPLTFSSKNFSSETIDWIFNQFTLPLIEVKNFSSPVQKNQACGAIQALKCLLFFYLCSGCLTEDELDIKMSLKMQNT